MSTPTSSNPTAAQASRRAVAARSRSGEAHGDAGIVEHEQVVVDVQLGLEAALGRVVKPLGVDAPVGLVEPPDLQVERWT
ncbi:hypothetical protein [Nocardioides sp. zg-1228]|uniref:hypothetical protein n=1 Tax=Nocardioides sp. zg-1228 TaxID=2763008 RepID=UPI001642FD37|nr:hypothetical protein [Nocardioides sp. zg-1228]MBC2932035.1 hypothetical protein [Nocardioides sp. zg-1228]QSF59780.1 hypothetical protein JX575_18995 [Nocardioides sp. zg-1228]